MSAVKTPKHYDSGDVTRSSTPGKASVPATPKDGDPGRISRISTPAGHSGPVFCSRCKEDGLTEVAVWVCRECGGSTVFCDSHKDKHIKGLGHEVARIDDLVYCAQHGLPCEVWCDDDQEPICTSKCIAVKHAFHKRSDLHEAVAMIRSKLKDDYAAAAKGPDLAHTKRLVEDIVSTRTALKTNYETAAAELRSNYEKAYKELKEAEEAQATQLSNLFSGKDQLLEEQHFSLTGVLTTFAKANSQIAELEIARFLEEYPNLKKSLAYIQEEASKASLAASKDIKFKSTKASWTAILGEIVDDGGACPLQSSIEKPEPLVPGKPLIVKAKIKNQKGEFIKGSSAAFTVMNHAFLAHSASDSKEEEGKDEKKLTFKAEEMKDGEFTLKFDVPKDYIKGCICISYEGQLLTGCPLHYSVGLSKIVFSDHFIGSKGAELGQFNTPRQICFSKGNWFICDALNHRIQVFRKTGAVSRSLLAGSDPYGICPIPNTDNIAVSDYTAKTISIYNSKIGAMIRSWDLKENGGYLCIDGNELYVTNLKSTVFAYDFKKGTLLRSFTVEGCEFRGGIKVNDGLFYGVDLKSGSVVVADKTTGAKTKSLATKTCYPWSDIIVNDGRVIVGAPKSLLEIEVSSGSIVQKVESKIEEPRGMDIGEGKIWVAASGYYPDTKFGDRIAEFEFAMDQWRWTE